MTRKKLNSMAIQSHLLMLFDLDPPKRLEIILKTTQKRRRLLQQRLSRLQWSNPNRSKKSNNLLLLTEQDHQFIDEHMTEAEKVILEIIDFLDQIMGNPHAKAFVALFASNKLPNLKELETLWRAVVSKEMVSTSAGEPSKVPKDHLSAKTRKLSSASKNDKGEIPIATLKQGISDDLEAENRVTQEHNQKTLRESSKHHQQSEQLSKATSSKQHNSERSKKQHLPHDYESIHREKTISHQRETERQQLEQQAENQSQSRQQAAIDRLHHARTLADVELAQELEMKFQQAKAKSAVINREKDFMIQHRREQQTMAQRIAQGRAGAKAVDSQDSAELKRAFELHKQSKKDEIKQRQKQEAELRRLQTEEANYQRRKKTEAAHDRQASESDAKSKAAKHGYSKPKPLGKNMQKDNRE